MIYAYTSTQLITVYTDTNLCVYIYIYVYAYTSIHSCMYMYAPTTYTPIHAARGIRGHAPFTDTNACPRMPVHTHARGDNTPCMTGMVPMRVSGGQGQAVAPHTDQFTDNSLEHRRTHRQFTGHSRAAWGARP